MKNKKHNKNRLKLRTDRILGLVALLLLLIASILGYQRSLSDNEVILQSLLEQNQQFQLNSYNIYEVYQDEASKEIGYIFSGEYMGYGGPLKVAILTDTNIVIQNLIITSHNETTSYVTKVLDRNLQRQIIGKTYADEFELDNDLDGVSGATYTSRALAGAAKEATQKIAVEQANFQKPETATPKVSFGFPEILLILLFALSLYGVYSKVNWKKSLRWGIMIVSFIVLGLWLSAPLSILKINTLLLGYWPEWHSSLYWYLLIGGALLTLLVTNKTIYCSWICPFGCAQECLGEFGKAKYKIQGRSKDLLLWVQRALAFAAIAAALYFRNPGKLNFEIFGTFFNLTGSTTLFVLTAIYVLSSLFIKRPYCDTLCPIRPFGEFLLMIKKWIMPKKLQTQ
jgi:NosR/NirI family transcriptional regulator, nitrous oxide reductase regulator